MSPFLMKSNSNFFRAAEINVHLNPSHLLPDGRERTIGTIDITFFSVVPKSNYLMKSKSTWGNYKCTLVEEISFL